ncbi:MAG: DUF1080 domain-containing protein, partial [Verrucomicrobia bacterium]
MRSQVLRPRVPRAVSSLPRNRRSAQTPAHSIPNMNSLRLYSARFIALMISLHALTIACADDFKPEPGFVSLFNGHDLTGWGYRTNNFDGKIASDDGRYSATNGVLVVHPREPRLIQKIWTTSEFSNNFILKLEFRAATNADSGIYIRGP